MKIQIRRDVLLQEVSGEAVLLSLGTGRYYGLNAVGTIAWKHFIDTGETQSACSEVVAHFAVSEEQAQRDIDAFAQELVASGLAEFV